MRICGGVCRHPQAVLLTTCPTLHFPHAFWSTGAPALRIALTAALLGSNPACPESPLGTSPTNRERSAFCGSSLRKNRGAPLRPTFVSAPSLSRDRRCAELKLLSATAWLSVSTSLGLISRARASSAACASQRLARWSSPYRPRRHSASARQLPTSPWITAVTGPSTVCTSAAGSRRWLRDIRVAGTGGRCARVPEHPTDELWVLHPSVPA